MLLGIHQRKWEMDSLCSVLKLGPLDRSAAITVDRLEKCSSAVDMHAM